MREVTCHEVGAGRVAEALDDIEGRTLKYWRGLFYGAYALNALREMRDELLDHVAARTLQNPVLDDHARTALRTAAECSLGLLNVGCYPKGDQEIPFPLIGRDLTSEDVEFHRLVEEAPTAATWVETFEVCVVSGLVWEWRRVIGLLLRGDAARTIHEGVPYSDLDSVSDPADLATMDALCGYLTPSAGHLPRDWPTVPLCAPGADERAEAARRLDAVGPLTLDQRLLRVLLDGDRDAFDRALAARLVEHREQVGADPAPRTLLPLGPLALAALAVQVHGWEPRVASGYLPPALLAAA